MHGFIKKIAPKRKLSIIIPYFNTSKYIEECLTSVIDATTCISSEILLINDFSTDNSEDIVKSFARKYPKVKMLNCHVKARGPGAARNLGILRAKGEYIAFVDSDDMVSANIFSDALTLLEEHGADLCLCDCSRYKDGKHTFTPQHNRAFSNLSEPFTTLEQSPNLVYASACGGKVCRTSLLRDNKILFPENSFYEDHMFSFKALFLSNLIAINRNVGYLWRVRGEDEPSITQREDEYYIFHDRARVNEMIAEYCNKHHINEQVRLTLFKKIAWYFAYSAFSSIESMSDDVLMERTRALGNYARKYFTNKLFHELIIIWEQTWKDILAENIEKIREDCFYRFYNYSKVPIDLSSGHPRFVFDNNIITIKRRDPLYDYALATPVCHIRDFEKDGSVITLTGELYFPRVSVAYDENRVLKAWVYNVITGEKNEIPRRSFLATTLTIEKGSLTNPDTGKPFYCDYDGCGFQIDLDTAKLLSELPVGKYLIMLEYYSPVKSGIRILRGIRKIIIDKLNGTSFKNDSRILKINVDERQTLQLEIMDYAD